MTMRNVTGGCLALFLALLVGGCSSEPTIDEPRTVPPSSPVWGSGKTQSEARTVAGFSQIALSGAGKLIIRQADTESLVIEAEANLLPLLTSDVSDGRLHLAARDNVSLHPTRPIVYRIALKKLTGLAISGSGDADVTGVDTDDLSTSISGSGSITVSGRATRQSIHFSGHGDYHAKDLDSDRADLDISGSGSAILKVKDRLAADIHGSGSVQYIGKPSTTLHISGSGSVTTEAQ